jgi:hypothetical protein
MKLQLEKDLGFCEPIEETKQAKIMRDAGTVQKIAKHICYLSCLFPSEIEQIYHSYETHCCGLLCAQYELYMQLRHKRLRHSYL